MLREPPETTDNQTTLQTDIEAQNNTFPDSRALGRRLKRPGRKVTRPVEKAVESRMQTQTNQANSEESQRTQILGLVSTFQELRQSIALSQRSEEVNLDLQRRLHENNLLPKLDAAVHFIEHGPVWTELKNEFIALLVVLDDLATKGILSLDQETLKQYREKYHEDFLDRKAKQKGILELKTLRQQESELRKLLDIIWPQIANASDSELLVFHTQMESIILDYDYHEEKDEHLRVQYFSLSDLLSYLVKRNLQPSFEKQYEDPENNSRSYIAEVLKKHMLTSILAELTKQNASEIDEQKTSQLLLRLKDVLSWAKSRGIVIPLKAKTYREMMNKLVEATIKDLHAKESVLRTFRGWQLA